MGKVLRVKTNCVRLESENKSLACNLNLHSEIWHWNVRKWKDFVMKIPDYAVWQWLRECDVKFLGMEITWTFLSSLED